MQSIRVNPNLDVEAIAATYARDRFVQIRNIFDPDTAQEIADILRKQVQWRLVYVDPDVGVVELTRAEAEQLGPQEMQRRMTGVMQRATRNYGYCYNAYHLTNAMRDGRDSDHPIHAVTRFLNSDAFYGFARTVIGVPGVNHVEAQATLFTQGSFLTRHIDDGAQKERRAAYTLSFCPNWQTDWGGLLQLIDQQTTDVTSAWVPRFNTLTIFDGTRVHAVSPVSAFAGDGRYSIVGWFREVPPA